MRKGILGGIALGLAVAMQVTALAQEAPMPPLRPDQVTFLALYKELVETNTTLSAGSCTLAAERMAAHLKSAGFADKDLTAFAVPDHPKEGGLVAILAGSSKTVKPMLLLGHLDVVEAKRADWTRDPFTFIEENASNRAVTNPNAPSSWLSPAVRKRPSPSTARNGWLRTDPS